MMNKQFFENEEAILRSIKTLGFRGFPHLIASGQDEDMKMKFIAINKMDIDLETLFMKSGKEFMK
jgi:hypothetical protein